MKSITSLYIHFPFCRHLCNYCDFYKRKLIDSKQIQGFQHQLDEQFAYHRHFLEKRGYRIEDLKTLYIGGGTPSLWGKSGAEYLKNKFIFTDSFEFTIEVDPDSWSEEEIELWLSIGVNRFSIGSQAFSEKFIKIMDRTHLKSDVEKTVKYFSDRKLNFSVDLMLGLPDSADRNITTEIDELLKYNPNHFSVYILKTRSNYPLNAKLPVDEKIREEYLLVSEHLRENGFDHYEVSNFARDGFYSKHNKKYWKYESVAGIGPNATGLLVGETTSRYQWKSVSLGVETEDLSEEAVLIEKIFLGLRARNQFDLDTLFKNEEQRNAIDNLYEKWKKLGYLRASSKRNGIDLSPLGYLMCDSLIDDIFKYVKF